MKNMTAAHLNDFLFDMETGFLMKYHMKEELDLTLLDQLYEGLVKLQAGWNDREEVPRDVLYYLIITVPALYNDLHLYQQPDKYSQYKTLIYDLNIEVANCLNPDSSHVNKPLSAGAADLKDFLFNTATGFLMKYHLKEGLDLTLLAQLYEQLEAWKLQWKDKSEVPKDILYYLITLLPALYLDLEKYEETDHYELYVELFSDLGTAMEMCLTPDTNSEHFKKPLRAPGY